MVKTIFSRLSMLVVLVVIAASCTKKTSEYTHVIPKDASALVAVHLEALIDKSGVNDGDKQKLIDLMKGELSPAAFQQIEKIIKDGSESGLSVKDPMYFFKSDLLGMPGVVFKVSDIEKLEKTFEVMASEQLSGPVSKADGYSVVEIENGGICAFNNSSLLITQSDDPADTRIIGDLLKQTADESIVSTEYFDKMGKHKGDISFFFTLGVIPDFYKNQFPMGIPGQTIKPEDMAMAGSLNFEKGKVAVQTENFSLNEEVKKMYKDQQSISGNLNETFLNRFPLSTLMYASVNINGKKMYDYIEKNKELFKNFNLPDTEQIKEIFGSIKGDISFGLINVTMNEAPVFAAYAEAENGSAWDALYAAKDEQGYGYSGGEMVKLGDNDYVYKAHRINIFLGYKDKYLYATNDEQIYKNMGKASDKSLKDAIYAPNMKGKKQYVVIDMNAILELPAMKMVTAMGGGKAATYVDMLSKISYLEIMAEDQTKAQMNLWLKDKDTNSLKQIIDLAKQFAGL